MARRRKDLWSARRRSAIERAKLLAATARSFPVDLLEIAEDCSVRRIEFRPLLTEGGLAVRGDGFTIYVRAQDENGSALTERFAKDGTGKTLPPSVAARARFTIAHEIAHTLFYSSGSVSPRPRIEINDPASAAKLELICNEIAGLILVPEILLKRIFSQIEVNRPDELRRVAESAMVSSETVVNRFRHLEKLIHPEAILLSARQHDDGWIISAISRHYSFKRIFPDAKVGAPIGALLNDPNLVLFGGKDCRTEVEYYGHGGKRMKMRFMCETPDHRRPRSIFLVGSAGRE